MGRVSRRRADGYIHVVEPGQPDFEADTVMCVHCNAHWYLEPGSGRQRGWCWRCAGPHCGGPACWTCVPLERKVDEALRRMALARQMGLAER